MLLQLRLEDLDFDALTEWLREHGGARFGYSSGNGTHFRAVTLAMMAPEIGEDYAPPYKAPPTRCLYLMYDGYYMWCTPYCDQSILPISVCDCLRLHAPDGQRYLSDGMSLALLMLGVQNLLAGRPLWHNAEEIATVAEVERWSLPREDLIEYLNAQKAADATD